MRSVALVFAAIAATVPVACAGSETGVEALGDPCGPLIYDGEGRPNVLIVSDLPLRGESRPTTAPIVLAIEHVLRQSGYRAGDFRVGYQSCDDAVGGQFDEARCEQNARAYAANRAVLGVIGPFNSSCAHVMLPLLSRRSAGPLATISPSNTYLGLTRSAPGTQGAGPARYYPDGVRNYVRLAPPEDAQGSAAALVARERGARRAVVLRIPGEPLSQGAGGAFLRTARRLGLTAAGEEWRPARSYTELAARVARRRPDAVYLAGQSNFNGRRLVEDLRAALGQDVLLLAPDAWSGAEVAASIGSAGDDLLVTVAGIPPSLLGRAGKAIMRAIGGPGRRLRGESYTAEAAQAAEVLLAAIARSDGTRQSVVAEIFRTRIRDGILGDFTFDTAGDINPASFVLYRLRDGREHLVGLVRAPTELVRGPS